MKKVFQIKLKSITRVFAMVMAISLVTFTGCKTYDEDIDKLNADLGSLKTELTALNETTKTSLTALITSTQNALNLQITGLNSEITALKARLTTLETTGATDAELAAVRLEILNKTVSLEAFNAYKTAVDAELAALKLKVDAAATKVELLALSTKVDAAATKTELAAIQTDLNAKITAINSELAALNTKLTTLQNNAATKAELEAAKAEILSKTVALTEYNANKAAVEALLSGLQIKIDAAATKVELAALATRLDAKIVEVEGTIVALGAKVNILQTNLNNLGVIVDEAKVKIDKNTADIAALKADVNARLAILEGVLNIQAGKSVVLDGMAAQLTTQLGLITANTTKIADLQAQLTTLAGKVTTLETQVATNTTDIAEIDAEIVALRAQLTVVNNNMKVLANAIHVNFDVLSSRLSSLTFVPTFFVNGIEAMNFSPLMSECEAITPEVEIAYHLNPSFITAADIETDNMSFALIQSQNLITSGGYMPAKAVGPQVKANFVKIENGKIYVKVSVVDFNAVFGNTSTNWTPQGMTENFPMIALQIPLSAKAVQENALSFDTNGAITVVNDTEYPADRVITAQYVRLISNPIYAQEDVYLAKIMPTTPVTYSMLPQTVAGAKALAVEGVDGATASDPLIITLPYGGTINLEDYVRAIYAGSPLSEAYGLKFKFDLKDDATPTGTIVYNRGSNNTDQQQFINISDANKGTINAKVFTQAEIAAAQGRTPIVRVTMYNEQDPNCPVLMSFVKIYIAEKPLPTPITVNFTWPSTAGPCADVLSVLTVQQMNEQIYNKVGMSKDEFHAAYPSALFQTSGDGIVSELYSPDSQTTDSYLLNWNLTALQIWTKLMTTDPASFTATAIYNPSMPTVYPKFTITFTRSFTKPAALNILPAQLITNYWYDNFTYVKHNIVVPAVGATNSALAIFENNINQAFEQNANKSLKALANYEYYFLPTQPKHVDGTTNGTTLSVSSDGKKIFIGNDTVATINPFVANTGDVLVLNKASVTAKRLLNYDKEFLTARIGIRTVYCENMPQFKMPVTVNGKAYFDVKFVRPINATTNPNEFFIDGKNFGETNTYLSIRKLVNLADWRNGTDYVSTFAQYPTYFQYYGVTSITADLANIKTDLNQTAGVRVPITNYPDLRVGYAASVAGVTPVAADGYLTYQNTGNTLGVPFYLYVPVTINYAWGSIVTTEITVLVKKTVGPSGVKAKK